MSEYGFRDVHPVVQMIYFLVSLVAIMIFTHPLILFLFIVGLTIYLVSIKGVRQYFNDIKFFIFLSLIVVLINPLFNQRGRNVLFEWNNKVITLEALVYGTIMAGMLLSIILLFQIFDKTVDSHKFIYVFSKFAPKSAFLSNMALRYIPLMKSRFDSLIEIKAKSKEYKKFRDKIKIWSKVISTLLTWSFEEAITTADSMKSRGYGLKERSNYRVFKWRNKDYLALIIVSIILISLFIYKFSGVLAFEIYPALSNIKTNTFSVLAYLLVFILAVLPYLYDEGEKIKWRSLE